MAGDIFVVGVGMTQFGRHVERSVASLADEALRDSGAAIGAIQQADDGGVTQSPLQGEHALPPTVFYRLL